MNDGMLSQEEIDALLSGTANNNNENQRNNDSDMELTPFEKDALGEIGNISFGNSATALSTLLNQKVDITTPEVTIIEKDKLHEEFPKPCVAVNVNYTSGFSGSNLFVIKQKDASIIADLMLGGDGRNVSEEIGELQLSAVQEAMNQMMGNAATSMSTVFQKRVEISPPTTDILDIPSGKGLENLPADDCIVQVKFRLIVGDLINSSIMQLFRVPFAKQLVSDLMNSTSEESAPAVQEQVIQQQQDIVRETVEESRPKNEDIPVQMNQTERGNDQLVQREEKRQQTASVETKKNVQPAVFTDFSSSSTSTVEEPRNLQMLFDIPLQVTVELGRTTKVVKEILELSPGSIIELDKLAGEPVDILVNQKLVARGEVVVIDENFGVRITDIISQKERLKNMN